MNTKLAVALLSGLSIGLSISAYALADGESADYIDWSYVNGVEKKAVVQEPVKPAATSKNIYNDPEYLDTETFFETQTETLTAGAAPAPVASSAPLSPVSNKATCAYSGCNSKTAEAIPPQRLAPVSIAQEAVQNTQIDPRHVQNPVKVEYPITKQYPVSVEYPVTVQRAVTVQQPVVMQQPVIVKKPVVMQQEITVQRQPAFVQQQPVVMEQPITYIQQQPLVVQSTTPVGTMPQPMPMNATSQLISTQQTCSLQPGYPCQAQPASLPQLMPQPSVSTTEVEFLAYGQTPTMPATSVMQPMQVPQGQMMPQMAQPMPVMQMMPATQPVQPVPAQMPVQSMGYATPTATPYYGY